MIAAGFGMLRLSPGEFWSMTTVEFAAMTGALHRAHASPLRRNDLENLMAAYPDSKRSTPAHE